MIAGLPNCPIVEDVEVFGVIGTVLRDCRGCQSYRGCPDTPCMVKQKKSKKRKRNYRVSSARKIKKRRNYDLDGDKLRMDKAINGFNLVASSKNVEVPFSSTTDLRKA